MDWKSKAEGIVSKFFESKKNSNSLLELEELLLSTDEECVLATLGVVSSIFSEIFSRGLLSTSTTTDKSNEYKLWLLNRYEDFISHLLSYLSHTNTEIQVASLRVLMSFVQLESKHLCRGTPSEGQVFPYPLFKKIMSCLASDVLDQQHLAGAVEEYSRYDDVKLYLLKAIQAFFNESSEITDLFLQNCFTLLCSIQFPKRFDNSTPADTFASYSGTQKFQLKEKPFRRIFSSVWCCLLNCELLPSFLKRVLCVLNESVLPHLQNPCLLTDFLTQAYNEGGVLSLLALKGLFLLMEKYNLEYPDFFVKLYALLSSNIVNGKFSSRFFHLVNLFLSSTHLPAHVVAAFAKKLSRLSLFSSANNILKIICVISNLLSNHPSLEVLIHRMNVRESSEDCFDFSAEDPAKSNALKSSLWEIKSLQSHINPEVCFKAKELTSSYPKFISDLSGISSHSLYDLYHRQRKRKWEDVPLSILRPSFKQRRLY